MWVQEWIEAHAKTPADLATGPYSSFIANKRLRWAKNVLKHSVIIPAAQQKEHKVSAARPYPGSMFVAPNV